MKALLFCAAILAVGSSLPAESLVLERTIPLPGVEGRIDHFAFDAAGGRLFVAALGINTVEVVDLKAGKAVHSITGLSEPQGIYYAAEVNRLYVANGGDGVVRVFDGTTFAPVTTIKFDDDADNVRYDATTKLLYVGYGDGGLGAINIQTNQIATETPLSAHPESFQLETGGVRVFINVPKSHEIAVVDRRKNAVTATWSLGLAAANFPMALDEANHRLMVACRVPARLLVFDTSSGKEEAKLDLHGDCDDLYFDPVRRQLYASCGEGYIDVFGVTGAGRFALREAIKTEPKARTCFFEGEHLYLAVPRRGNESAQLRCFRIASQPP